jgi:hypothetical protein
MGSAPPGHERVRITGPAFAFEKWRGDLGQPRLHVNNRSVLVEHADLDRALQFFDMIQSRLHRSPGPIDSRAKTRISQIGLRSTSFMASMMALPMNLQTVDLNLLVALDTMLNAKPK